MDANTNVSKSHNESVAAVSTEHVHESMLVDSNPISIDNNLNVNGLNNGTHHGYTYASSNAVGSMSSVINHNTSSQESQRQIVMNGNQILHQQQQGNFCTNNRGGQSASSNQIVMNQGLNGAGAAVNGKYNENTNISPNAVDSISSQVPQQQIGDNMSQSVKMNENQMMQQQQQGNFNRNSRGAPSAINDQGLNGLALNGNYNGNQNQLHCMNQNPNMYQNQNMHQNMNMNMHQYGMPHQNMHHQSQQQQNSMNRMDFYQSMHPPQMQVNPVQNPMMSMSAMFHPFQMQQQMQQQQLLIDTMMKQQEDSLKILEVLSKCSAAKNEVTIASQRRSLVMNDVLIVTRALKKLSSESGTNEMDIARRLGWTLGSSQKHRCKLFSKLLHELNVVVNEDELHLTFKEFRTKFNADQSRAGTIFHSTSNLKRFMSLESWKERYPDDLMKIFPWHADSPHDD